MLWYNQSKPDGMIYYGNTHSLRFLNLARKNGIVSPKRAEETRLKKICGNHNSTTRSPVRPRNYWVHGIGF